MCVSVIVRVRNGRHCCWRTSSVATLDCFISMRSAPMDEIQIIPLDECKESRTLVDDFNRLTAVVSAHSSWKQLGWSSVWFLPSNEDVCDGDGRHRYLCQPVNFLTARCLSISDRFDDFLICPTFAFLLCFFFLFLLDWHFRSTDLCCRSDWSF